MIEKASNTTPPCLKVFTRAAKNNANAFITLSVCQEAHSACEEARPNNGDEPIFDLVSEKARLPLFKYVEDARIKLGKVLTSQGCMSAENNACTVCSLKNDPLLREKKAKQKALEKVREDYRNNSGLG